MGGSLLALAFRIPSSGAQRRAWNPNLTGLSWVPRGLAQADFPLTQSPVLHWGVCKLFRMSCSYS